MLAPTLLKERQKHSRIFAMVLILLLIISKPLIPFGTLFHELLVWGGYILIIIGAFGRIYCSAFIGGRKNDVLIRSGPFSMVRNPLYVFSFIATVGIGMQSGMLIILVILISAFIFYYPMVVNKEEGFLENKFGEDYRKYKNEVPRWFPNFNLWQEPETIEVKPVFIRRTIMDASIFFLPFPIFILIHSIQADNTWLTLLTLL